ncbi:MAG: hypothetical protein R2752_17840 [Vicinamibacterales bacterium]
MSIFEPLFLLLALIATVTLVVAGVLAMAGRRDRAGRVLRRLGVAAALYFVVAIAVSAASPRRYYQVGEERCFDDWCLTVTDVRRAPTTGGRVYDVSLRLSNHARRVPMGERGTVVYLTDGRDRRFDPIADPSDVPFDAVLQPGESVTTHRRFDVPADARDLGLVYRHEGGFPIAWFIIGEGGWFGKPAIVRLE